MNHLNRIFMIFLIFSLIKDIYPQDLPKTKPEEAGISPERLERLSDLIQNHIDEKELSGAVMLVVRDGKIVYEEAFGFIDIENNISMRDDAIFRTASMTKMFTSAAFMALYEEGVFNLNDPVSKYIPEFKNMKVAVFPEGNSDSNAQLSIEPAKSEITIKDLMRHTAGFTYSSGYSILGEMYKKAGLDAYNGPPLGSLPDFIDKISALPLAFHPGTNWEYSYATDIIGYLIEIISKQPLDVFMEDRIFKPLNMKDTGFTITDEKLNRFANLYEFKDGKLILLESAAKSPFRKQPGALSGGGGWDSYGYGGLISTAEDYARFLQMLMNNGELNGIHILSRKTVELMLSNQLINIPNNWLGSGVGFNLCSAVLDDVHEYGNTGSKNQIWWAGSCNTYFFMDAQEKIIGVFMTQMLPFLHLGLMGKFKHFCHTAIIE